MRLSRMMLAALLCASLCDCGGGDSNTTQTTEVTNCASLCTALFNPKDLNKIDCVESYASGLGYNTDNCDDTSFDANGCKSCYKSLSVKDSECVAAYNSCTPKPTSDTTTPDAGSDVVSADTNVVPNDTAQLDMSLDTTIPDTTPDVAVVSCPHKATSFSCDAACANIYTIWQGSCKSVLPSELQSINVATEIQFKSACKVACTAGQLSYPGQWSCLQAVPASSCADVAACIGCANP